jgi:phosphoglycerate kinase
MRSIKELKNIKGKRVIVRVDFNVPMKSGKVENDFKIRKAIPTIKFLSKKGAKVVLITHLGRGDDSLLPVYKNLTKLIKAKFIKGVVGSLVEKEISKMKSGDVVLLENLRKDKGEKSCDKNFALLLSKLGDIYVNEAFPVSHREDASIVLLPKMMPSYAGFQLSEEVEKLTLALKPKHPFLFIAGGVKFETKLPLIKKYLTSADKVFVGGALANTLFFQQGYEIGESVADKDYKIPNSVLTSKKLLLPDNVVVDRGNKRLNINLKEVKKGDYIVDVGIKSIDEIIPLIKKSKLVLWNGPIGWDRNNKTTKGTPYLLKLLSKVKADTILGGGETVASVEELGLEKKFTFVSTGGGATLEFLSKGTLPGIKALQ